MSKARSMLGTQVFLNGVNISDLVYSIKVGGAVEDIRMADVALYVSKVSTDDNDNLIINLGSVG